MLTSTDTRDHQPQARRVIDWASLALLIVGLICGLISYIWIETNDSSPLLMVAPVVAATIGAKDLVKHEAPHG